MTQSASGKRVGLIGSDIPVKDDKPSLSLQKRMSMVASPSDLKKASMQRKSTQHPRTADARESVTSTLKVISDTEAQLNDLQQQLQFMNSLTDTASAFIEGIAIKSRVVD